MGNCADGACCGREGNFTTDGELRSDNILLSGKVKKFSREDLTGGKLSIGENEFDSPLTRKALLAENHSHIYDRKFEWANRDKIAKLQARVRCFIA